MVTNLNNYGKQIRFMLSTDDPTEVEWENGDMVFLMDQDKLYVFDADNSTFKEISMGGGGGGGEAHPYIQTFDYVLAENWSTDSNGNVQNFVNTYCNNGNGLYWAGVSQNSADQWRAVRGFYLRQTTGNVQQIGGSNSLRSESQWSTSSSTTSSFHIKAGAKIKVWYIPNTTTLEDLV